MDDLERPREPLTLLRAQARGDRLEVVLVLVEMVLRLVQQLDLRHDDRDPCRRVLLDFADRPGDGRVATADPDAFLDVVQEELQLVASRFPGLYERRASGRPCEDWMDRQLEALATLPRIEPARPLALEQLPIREARL